MNTNLFTKKVAAVTIAGALALSLSACGSEATTNTQDIVDAAKNSPTAEATVSPEASATPEPVETSLEEDGRWGIDPASVEIPADVREAYGDTADTLVLDAMITLNEGYVMPAELHTGGWEQDTYDLFWNDFTDTHLTSDFAEVLNDSGSNDDRDVLMPVTSQDGVAFSLEGVDYTTKTGWDAAMDRNIIVGLDEDGRATVAVELVVTFDTDPALVVLKRHVNLHLVPAGDEDDVKWLIDGATYTTPSIEVQEG